MSGIIERRWEAKAKVEELFGLLSSLEVWSLWPGAGKVPSVVSTSGKFESGSVIRFKTSDGAEHEQKIIELIPNRKVRLHLQKIGMPVSFFIEELYDNWEFDPLESSTWVRRLMEIRFRRNIIAEMLGRNLLIKHFGRAIDIQHTRIAERLAR